jgi:hypothetical protein
MVVNAPGNSYSPKRCAFPYNSAPAVNARLNTERYSSKMLTSSGRFGGGGTAGHFANGDEHSGCCILRGEVCGSLRKCSRMMSNLNDIVQGEESHQCIGSGSSLSSQADESAAAAGANGSQSFQGH